MENLLAMKKLDKCVRAKPNLPSVSSENDPEKLVEAKSILSLSVEESLIVQCSYPICKECDRNLEHFTTSVRGQRFAT